MGDRVGQFFVIATPKMDIVEDEELENRENGWKIYDGKDQCPNCVEAAAVCDEELALEEERIAQGE